MRLEESVSGRGLSKVLEHTHMASATGHNVSGHPLISDLGLVNSRLAQSLHP